MSVVLPKHGHITHEEWRQCSVEGCILVYRALGLCETHYRQRHRKQAAIAAWDTPPPPPRRHRVVRGGVVRWETPDG